MPRGTRRRSTKRRLITLASFAIALSILSAPPGAARADSAWATGPSPRGPIALERTPMGIWIVAATLNGHVSGRFLLDTGATWCAITSRTAARLRLAQVGEHVDMQTAAGIVPMPLVRLGSVQVGGHRARRVQAVILPDEIGDLDGVIGMNFLNEFTYAIDPRRGVLELD